MAKRVYVAYTGGTIGMLPSPGGYKPEPVYLKKQLKTIQPNDLESYWLNQLVNRTLV